MKENLGSLFLLALIGGAIWYFYQKADLRDPLPGELLLIGQVAHGPGQDCWILNAETGERFNFFGTNLGKLRTVGARVKMIVIPRPDKISSCNQGRIVTVVEYKIIKTPDYGGR